MPIAKGDMYNTIACGSRNGFIIVLAPIPGVAVDAMPIAKGNMYNTIACGSRNGFIVALAPIPDVAAGAMPIVFAHPGHTTDAFMQLDLGVHGKQFDCIRVANS
jgi:hypothetical protein